MNIFDTWRRLFCFMPMYFGGGSGTQNSVSKFEPPDFAKAGWETASGMADQMLNNPWNPYMGMRGGAAPINSDQYRAGDLVYQTATLGSPDTNAGRGAATDFANGMYVNSNPWLSNEYTQNAINQNADAMARAYAVGTAAQHDSAAARAGAYGGSAANEVQANGAAGLANQIGQMANNYQLQHQNAGAQDYQNSMAQMLQGAQLGMGGQGLDLNAANALSNWGQKQQDYTNTLLGQAEQRYNEGNNYSQAQLQNYLNMLSQMSGAGNVQTQSIPGASPWANLLGAGAAGIGAYNLFKT